MARIGWDRIIDRTYRTGVDHAVLFVADSNGVNGYAPGVAWNGVISVTEQASGGEPNKVYADNKTYLTLLSNEEFGATIEVYQYPKQFNKCKGVVEFADGAYVEQQNHKSFCLSYRTKIGNAMFGEVGDEIHIIYGCLVSTMEKAHNTISDTVEPSQFSITVSTTPSAVRINGKDYKPTAHITINGSELPSAAFKAIEKALYGDPNGPDISYLPTPTQIYNMIINNQNYLLDCNGIYLQDCYGRFLCYHAEI